MLSLGYGCGMRVGELEKINIKDIKLRESIVIVPKGKGNKRRIIPMSPGVKNDIQKYYFEEREILSKGRDYNKAEEAFMLNSRGGRMREHSYNRTLKIIIERSQDEAIKSKKLSIHSLRHSIASHLIEQGMEVNQVRQFLGHSQLETTQHYTHINKNQIKNMIHDST